MKKNLLILVILLVIALVPGNVKAGVKVLVNEGDYKCKTETNALKKKVTTCVIAIKNTDSTEFAGGTLTLEFSPKNNSTTWDFKLGTAKENTTAKTDKSVELHINPIAAGKTIEAGTVTWTADSSLQDADCGGDVIPEWKSTTTEGNQTIDNTSTGYAIPYVALAVGAVGVVTVLATSKKKTKMYKI